MRRWPLSVATVALACVWLLAGCMSEVVLPPATTVSNSPLPTAANHDLPFETIRLGDRSHYYYPHPLEPQHVFLITSIEEASQMAGYVEAHVQEELMRLDYGSHFAIAVFRGHFGSSGYEVNIQRVVRRGNSLVLAVQFWYPSPYYAVTAAESDPYHLIKVARDGGPLRASDVVLEVQNVTPTPPVEIRRLTAVPPP